MSAYEEQIYFEEKPKDKTIKYWSGHLAERDPKKIEQFNKMVQEEHNKKYKKSPNELEAIRHKQLQNFEK